MSAYFYALTEWVFFVTKPSSLSVLSTSESLKVLMVTGGEVATILLLCLFLLAIPGWLIKDQPWHPRLVNLRTIPAAAILSITVLILIDNFTYTVFKFGVISTEGFGRFLYAVGFGVIFWQMMRFTQRTARRSRKIASFLSWSLLAVSLTGFLSIRFSNDSSIGRIEFENSASKSYPNIIVLGSDGLSASYLSAYGSTQQTTPFLNELIKTSLVAENAFPNASSTTASTTSVLTGKEPIVDKVFRYPDILAGESSFQHMPGILKQQGYQTVEIGTPYYVDALRLNLLDGFETVNNQSLDRRSFDTLRRVLGNSPSTYFIQTIMDRAIERLLHIFFIREMQNPLAEVYDPNARITDDQRVEQIIDLLDKESDRPLFVFAHLMDTHGPGFSFDKKVFSSVSDKVSWDSNRYRDAILNFDGHVKKVYDYLERTGKLDNTILVIYTDHGFQYTTYQRIPLIIHFPKELYTGTIKNNVEIIDIPVTLLDYLSIPSPDWMTGMSLLQVEPPQDRKIFSTTTGSPEKSSAPFYQIQSIQMLVCQKWYRLNVRDNTWRNGTVINHTAKCDESTLPTDKEIREELLKYLQEHGYKTDSLGDGS